ncbi:DUF4249 domain-containing protein [Polluticaenibacter yanchengensis]|uniref:DUF4249 domain-containing protein n=1 Tax=Polluticaenibacter yanchengensis TaxID=3014562 RepID=A0ABT4UNH1_9BACT|nr:DUF4249 domain-containing protein [Chitinophagaceae bacterium LY-5]
MALNIKNTFLKSLPLALLVLTTACQKVIDIDLKDTPKKMVIEAVVTDIAGQAKVLITQTKNYNESNTPDYLPGGKVSISDNEGNTVVFSETATGRFEAPALVGQASKTYTLKVEINNQTYTSSVKMPEKVVLDDAYITEEFLFGENRKMTTVDYQDPPGVGNFYRCVQFINGKKDNTIYINSDDYTDGRYMKDKLFYIADEDKGQEVIKSGDEIKVEFMSLEKSVYKYWFSLDMGATGENQAATPANPVSNITNGALGYFSVHPYQSKTFIVP